jgi:hypothetical protein
MAIALYCQPHADTIDGRIYTVGALIIFLSMFLSLLMKVKISDETKDSQYAFAVILVILNVLMVGAALAQMAFVGRRAYMSRQKSVLGIGKIDHTNNNVSGDLEESTEDTNDSAVKPSAASMLSRHGGGGKQHQVNGAVDEEQQQCEVDRHEVKF